MHLLQVLLIELVPSPGLLLPGDRHLLIESLEGRTDFIF